MAGAIDPLQQRAVMMQIEELIQSTPDYSGVQEALRALHFVPATDKPEFAVWLQPDLEIYVLLMMNLGGGYASYRVATFDEMEEFERQHAERYLQ